MNGWLIGYLAVTASLFVALYANSRLWKENQRLKAEMIRLLGEKYDLERRAPAGYDPEWDEPPERRKR
jgi:hypothetical protein